MVKKNIWFETNQFINFLRHNNGHVTRVQFRQCLNILELPAREDEMLDLEARFCDDVGFNYLDFLEQVDGTQGGS